MKTSIMTTKKVIRILSPILVFLFWLSVWWIFSLIVGDPYFLPSPVDTLRELVNLLAKPSFYTVVLFSLFRVVAGLTLGITVGMSLAFVAHYIPVIKKLVSPAISIVKAMPVATFILILWITLRGSKLTIFIGFIMVMPIIYQNVVSGLASMDKKLIEVAKIFNFSLKKRLKFLILPSLKSYLYPAIITSVGLAFKSQIAAEIIAYTKNSIGQYIYDANYGTNTAEVFAWAAVIVVFSIALEYSFRLMLREGRSK